MSQTSKIIVERTLQKTIGTDKVKAQLRKCIEVALSGGRGRGWTGQVGVVEEPKKKGDMVVHRVSCSFKKTMDRESLDGKWPAIVKRFAESACAGNLRAAPWVVVEPTGYKEIAEQAMQEQVKGERRKEQANEDKVLGEVNLEPLSFFERIYGREAQIRRTIDALKLAQRTEWRKRRNTLFSGRPGCHTKGTKVLTSTGREVAVEDVQVGDRLLSHDGYRIVQELVRGTGKLYTIIPTKGDPFTVNEDHILTLVKSREPDSGEWVDVTVKEWLEWSDRKKSDYKLFRSGRVEFDVKNRLSIDPYALGLLLGDGSLVKLPRYTCHMDDFPFVPEITMLAESYGLTVNVYPKDNCFDVTLTNPDEWRANGLQSDLRQMGVGEKRAEGKFIPMSYKTAGYKDRLELLAGIIDTDGEQHGNVICVDSKSEQLVRDVMFVARSLGFAAYYGQKEVDGEVYHRAHLSGDLYLIPCRLERKRCHPRQQIKDVLRTGFTAEYVGEGDYYGFVLDGDHRYLMADFTVTHNCGKSETMLALREMLGKEGEAWRWFDAPNMTKAGAIEELMESPVVPPVLFIEEIEKVQEEALRWLLGVMDIRGEIRRTNYRVGNQARNVHMFVIASANNVELLKSVMSGALYSRFQNKVWFPEPDRDLMARILTREVEEIDGDPEWVEPALRFAVDRWGMTDPREVINIVQCGAERLMTGDYQKDYEATMEPDDKRYLIKMKKKRAAAAAKMEQELNPEYETTAA